MKSKICKMIPMFLVLLILVAPYVLADSTNGPISPSITDTGDATVTEIVSPVQKVYGSAVLIIRIIAFTIIIFTGVKYMFSAAEQRADTKQSLIHLMIGASIVFGATIIIDVLMEVAKSIL